MAGGGPFDAEKKIVPEGDPKEQEHFTFVDHADGTLSLAPRRNLMQALVILVFMGIGAFIGFLIVDDRPGIAALAGAAFGMIAGTFSSGFVMMFLPPSKIRLTRDQFQRKYLACRTRLWIASVVALLMLVALPFVISIYGRKDTSLAWLLSLGWPLITIAACVYANGLAQRIRRCRCPLCNEPLHKFRKVCPQCGFPMVPDSKDR